MENIEDKRIESELNVWCDMVYNYTKEFVQNSSKANKWFFDRITHDEWTLELFPKHLASVNAYNSFFNLTGKDIRDCDWNSRALTKDGEKILVHQHFVDEHMTTAHDFKYEIIELYKRGELTVEKIKELMSKQRLCWITKEENEALTKKGYRKHRKDPLLAYTECGIEIYDKENEDLENIMKPTFELKKKEKQTSQATKKEAPQDVLINLQAYLNTHLIDGKKISLVVKDNISHAWVFKKKGFMINVRVRGGILKDICLYIDGASAKAIFNKLLLRKKEIEASLGYELAWDENLGGKAARIGRFFKGAKLISPFEIENKDKCFDFNVENKDYIEKTAKILVEFYNVFVPIITNT